MISKLEELDKLVAMIGDENLKEEIIDKFLEILIHYGEEKLKEELELWLENGFLMVSI